MKFFYEKVISTWTEPTFQSIWTGPQTARQQYTFTPLLQSLYKGKDGYKRYYIYSIIILFSLYLFSSLSLIAHSFKKDFSHSAMGLYSAIFFLGGFFFHLLWETKSQYIYIYVLLLIPSAAQSLVDLSNWWKRKGKGKSTDKLEKNL